MIPRRNLLGLVGLSLLLGVGLTLPFGAHLIVALLGLAAIVLGARRPDLLLYLLAFWVAAIPHGLAAKRALAVSLGGVPFHPVDLLFLGCMASWGFAALIAIHRDRGEFTATWRRHGALLWPFLCLMVVVVISAIVGLFHQNDLWDIVRDLRSAAYYGVLPVAVWTIDSRKKVRILIAYLVAGVTLFSLLCIFTAVADDEFYLRQVTLTYWHGKARFYFHNHYLLAFTIPLMTYQLLLANRWWQRGLAVVLLGLFTTTLVLSLTRNLMGLTLGAVLLVPVLLAIRKHGSPLLTRRQLAATALLFSLSVGLSTLTWRYINSGERAAIPSLGQRFATLDKPAEQDSSFRGRIVSYRYGLEDSLESPVLGKGFGMLFRIPWGTSKMRPVRVEGYQPAVDMTPLTVLGKSGVLGIMVLAWFGFTLFLLQWRSLHSPRAGPATQILAAVLLASTLGLFVSSMLHTVLLTSLIALPFAMICAITSRLTRLDEEALTG